MAKQHPNEKQTGFDRERADGHTVSLCAAHGIAIGTCSRRGRAGRQLVDGGKGINIPEIRGQVSYFVALHEIGHLVGKGRSAPRLESEANAWLYALEESLFKPTPATRRAIKSRLWSYLSWALERQHREHPPRLPSKGHAFWRLSGESYDFWVEGAQP